MKPSHGSSADRRQNRAQTAESTATLAPGSPRRPAVAALVALGFITIVAVNLVFPEHRGPSDQGDFTRIVTVFSTGPRDLPLWPAEEALRDQRFFHQYLGRWTYGGGFEHLARASTSHLVFLPERFRGWLFDRKEFDLSTNTSILLVALGLLLFATLSVLTEVVPFLALSAAAVLMADLRISWYLNSFYTESGAILFAFTWLCLAFAWWQTRSVALLLASLVTLVLLAGTKLPYGPSVVPIALAVAALALPLRGARFLAAAIAIAIALGFASLSFFADHRARTEFDNAFHFVFSGALPRLPLDERAAFLESIGLDTRHAAGAGRGAYDLGGPAGDPVIREHVRGSLHARAVWRLARDHPEAMLWLLLDALAATGRYDIEGLSGYGWRERNRIHTPETLAFRAWSDARSSWIAGWPPYAGLLLGLALVARLAGREASSWTRFFTYLAMGCLVGSLLQVAIAAIGNGLVDQRKQLFLANLLFDFSLVLTAAGAVSGRRRQRWRHTIAPRGLGAGGAVEPESSAAEC